VDEAGPGGPSESTVEGRVGLATKSVVAGKISSREHRTVSPDRMIEMFLVMAFALSWI
jgi:hypothetical protein